MLCFEAGIKPEEYYDLSFEETTDILQAYRQRKNVALEQTRLVMYSIISTVTKPEDRGEVYDIFYIDGDPTPEQRMQAQIEYNNSIIEENRLLAESIRKENELKQKT